MKQTSLEIDGGQYSVHVTMNTVQPVSAPRLVVVAYQPNQRASDVLRACLRAIQKFTPGEHELWVVDNNSPAEHADWLQAWPDINVIRNLTPPIPPQAKRFPRRLWRSFWGRRQQREWGSYANAAALEIAARIIDPQSYLMMPLHMDTMPCHENWLPYLQSKVTGNVAAAGVRMDMVRVSEGVLHVLGYLVDFQRFRQLNLDFWPQLPQYDVGDRVTVALRQAGYNVFACPNTIWQPALIEEIPVSSPLRHLPVDRALDDDGNVIFLHLGRAVRKSVEGHHSGLSVDEWLVFADELMASEPF
ncbi:MAG: hypothetical protein H6667_21730 [Ardenticatenaceae bacterium]|nr:hypothetical protein [Ardenticatenaceae bacterium]